MLRRLTVACSVVAVVAALVYGLTRDTNPVIASNGISPAVFPATPLSAGGRLCDALGPGASRADALQVTAGSIKANPPLRLSYRGQAKTTTLRGWDDGVILLRLPSTAPEGEPSEACVENLGPEPVFIAGSATGNKQGAVVNGKRGAFSYSFRLVRDDPPRWSAVADSAVERIGFARGSAATGSIGWLLLLPFVGAIALGLVSAWRWGR